MRFVKLRMEANHRNEEAIENWYLLIDNEADLLRYLSVDAGLYASALFSMRRTPDEHNQSNVNTSHLSTIREKTLSTYIDCRTASAKQGEAVWPHKVVSEIVHKKAMAMFNAIMRGEEIQITEGGGWSQHVVFKNMWKATVVDSIEKQDCTFPTDEDIISADILFLENSSKASVDFINEVKQTVGDKPFRVIANLKERDSSWLYKCIAESKCIALETQAVDSNQLNGMMQMFKNIYERKTVIIKTTNREAIQEHPLFYINSLNHDVTFID